MRRKFNCSKQVIWLGYMAENNGLGADILASYLASESEGSNPGEFGIDIFSNAFEDEFPGDNEDPGGGTYQGYSPEGNRATENRPWGGNFGDRPKIHELNQPDAAQFLGWRAIDLIPRRNIKEVFHRLAGTPAELRQIVQIIQATRRLTGANIDFDQWFELWRNGFLDFTENRTFGNFQIVGEAQWARFKDPETRPRWREWSTSIQRADYGFRVGEYWPNASVETNSMLLSGTDLQLINHVIQIEYEGGGTKNAEAHTNNKGWPPLKGQPLIKFYFLGVDGKEAETSFRIMSKSDDPRSPLPKIQKDDLRKYAASIKEQLSTPSLFTWQKGRDVISYRNRWQGFESWYLCRNEAAGRALLVKLLAIAGHTLDEASIRYTTASAVAFPSNPADITVLGEVVKEDSERPLVDVNFYRAEIKLSKLRYPIPLVERGRILYE